MEGDVVVLQDIFIYEQTGLDTRGKVREAPGYWHPPRFLQRLTAEGIFIPAISSTPPCDHIEDYPYPRTEVRLVNCYYHCWSDSLPDCWCWR